MWDGVDVGRYLATSTYTSGAISIPILIVFAKYHIYKVNVLGYGSMDGGYHLKNRTNVI